MVTPDEGWPELTLGTELARREEARQALARLCLGYFAEQVRRIRGRPFSFEGHEYLRELYEEHHDYTVIEKAAQMGASEYAISKALHLCASRPGTCVIVFFPTDQDVRDFSRHRVAPAVEDLRAAGVLPVKTAREVENVGQREIGESMLYFRGMQSGIRMKSVPADMLIFDELDESPAEVKSQARERLSHSELKWTLELSTPTLPDYGIDVEFQRSDQRHWHVECGCADGVVLEHAFPECLASRADGRVELVCPECGRGPLDPSKGRWVAHRPEARERRGYHLSQLFSSAITPKEILEEFETTRNLAEFHNSKLGIPYAGDRMPLTRADLLKIMGDHELRSAPDGACVMGLDQGDVLHAVVACRGEGTWKVIDIAELREFGEAAELIRRYDIAMCVIDGQPNKHSARDLARAFPRRVALSFYSEGKRDEADLDPSKDSVTVDRTEAMDRMVACVKRGEVALPRRLCKDTETFIRHLTSVAKVVQEDERTGRQVARYIRTGPDHYAHALTFAFMAMDRLNRVPVVMVQAGRARM